MGRKNNNSDSAKKKKNDEVKDKNDDECKGGIRCHQCLHQHRPNEAIKCRVFKCKLSYGVSCLMRKYPGEDFMVKGWICPRCRGMCNCKKCLQLCNNCMKLIVQQNGLEDLDVEKDAMINKEEELNTTISSLKKKQEESNTIICELEANVSSLKASLAHEESQNLALEREQGSLREELQRIKDSNSSLLQHIQLQNEHLKHLSSATKHFEFLAVENDAMKKKEEDLNATISSLKAALANEESQNLKRLEDLSANQISVLQALAATNQKLKVKFTAEEPLRKLRRIMDNKHNIRNITVIAHVDHGKSTLTDSLVAAAAAVGIIAQETAGDVRMTDTGISLYYQITDEALKSFKGERNGDDYLINVIDLSSSALRITDGALVVVDCIEGVCVQTKTVLRQALGERIRPVLIIDKMDKCFLELKVDGEEAYQTFQKIIENFNLLMASYKDPVLGDSMVYPKKGTVVFSSGSHGWAFTLTNFAKMYAGKFGVDESKMMERLWGENFFDPKTKKWTKQNTGAATCKRGFVQLCYEPIQRIIDFCMNGKKDVLWLLLAKFGVTMKSEDKELMGKLLMKRVMQNWLPTAMALLEMMIFHLPSPHAAQRYRVDNLYQGPVDDAYANAIRNCDPNGPMVLYVSKMIPASDKGRFFAFGRVFAGKVSTGMKVRIMGPNYVPGEKKDLYVKSVQRTVIWMGKKQETVEDVPCGNTVAITVEGSGENIIAGLCFEDLEEDFMGGAESDLAVKGR